ncbi:chaperone modulator CbpM [Bizionia argentinensis]|nr:chaperone modulator CbpM [Bizionia argentinensis]
MDTKNVITITEFCQHYDIPESFIITLSEYELVEISTESETPCIYVTEIKSIEKLIRFHFELDINIEGIDAISNLLNKVERLQEDVKSLNNKLRFYKEGD